MDGRVAQQLLTVDDVAGRLQLSAYTIREWARLGKLPCIRLTHRIRFEPRDIDKWLKERRWSNGELD